MIKDILLVGLGGGIGRIACYLCQRLASAISVSLFPWGTFAVNIIGCFIIGILWGLSIKPGGEGMLSNDWKLFLMTGLCGGFTTFSAYSLESIQLLREQKLLLFLAYVLGSVALGLLATYIGIKTIK